VQHLGQYSEPSDFERTASESADNHSAAVSTAHRLTDECYDERIVRSEGEGGGGGGDGSEVAGRAFVSVGTWEESPQAAKLKCICTQLRTPDSLYLQRG
jgi:hypothetical protein